MSFFRVRKIVPPELRHAAMRQVLVALTRQMGVDVEKDLARITQTWRDKPKFEVRTHATISANRMDTTVETDHQHFIWVSEGTKAHWVPRRGRATMSFRRYRAKTRVGWLGSTSGGPTGPRITRTGRWRVSGIKARHYDEALARKWQPEMERRAFQAITVDAVEAGGHGI